MNVVGNLVSAQQIGLCELGIKKPWVDFFSHLG